jgi:hypothetical protein
MIVKSRHGFWLVGTFTLLGACASACGTDNGRVDAHADAAVSAGGASGAGAGGSAGQLDGPASSGGSSTRGAGGARASSDGGAPASATGGRSEPASGGRSEPASGGTPASANGGRSSGDGGKTTSAGAGGVVSGDAGNADCDAPGLVWKTANKTNYTSYPDPGSEECIKYNGCMWAGQFAACSGTKTEAWVSAHNIVAAFPDFTKLSLHDLCLRKGSKTIVVTVLDTCGDSDCNGCCTQNKGAADELIDVESYTNERWGVADGRIDWADLGPTKGAGCN